jgi:hypothetical protein
MKALLIAILGLLLLGFACSGINAFFHPEPDLINPGEIRLSILPDSTYRGLATCGPVKVKLDVEVRDHSIARICILKHRTGQGQAAEAITEEVIRAQHLQVDVISGATISSKTILLAIEYALDTSFESPDY